MEILKFNYTKVNGDKSPREVMKLVKTDKWIDAIDLSKLSEEEIIELKDIQEEYESKIKPFSKKGFRRFLVEGIKYEDDC